MVGLMTIAPMDGCCRRAGLFVRRVRDGLGRGIRAIFNLAKGKSKYRRFSNMPGYSRIVLLHHLHFA